MAKTIAVIGGGLAGRLCAWQLAQAGWRVSLFDRGGREGGEAAAYIAAAMLAPLAEAIDATPLVTALGRQSVARWRRLLEQLPEQVFLQQAGSLVVWHAQDKPLAHQFEQQLSRAWGGDCPAQWWQAEQLASEEPQLAGRFQTGLYLPDEGQLENRQVLSALGAALEREKVDCRWHSEVSPQQLAGQFDWLLDCRGFGAKTDWNAAQGSRLRGVRGEVARVCTGGELAPAGAPAASALSALYCAQTRSSLCNRSDPIGKRKRCASQRTIGIGIAIGFVCGSPGLRRGADFRTFVRFAADAESSRSGNPL